MTKTDTVWHALTVSQALKKLQASREGLSAAEARKRLAHYGTNILAEKAHFSVGILFLSQFKSALVYVLLLAALVSLLFREFIDAYVIFGAVLINVIVGFIQEYKANKSLEQLSQVVKKEALVWREGQEQKIASSQLVPGDILVLKAGDRVAADGRLLEANGLEINEASLTGESWPAKKDTQPREVGIVLADRENMVYLGTLVAEGKGLAVVIATGLATEMGHITKLLKDTGEQKTPLQLRLDVLAKNITWLVSLVALLLFVFGLLRNYPLPEIFTIAVAVAVSAIPEGLVISMTMILTVGMRRILQHKGLVRRLVSAETLGSTTVICTDKTGTLTEGEMRVTQILTAHYHRDLSNDVGRDWPASEEIGRLAEIAVLCNDSIVENPTADKADWRLIASPTDKALFLFGLRQVDLDHIRRRHALLEELPFDSERKFMMTRHRYDANYDIIFIKGAPEKILSFADWYLDDHQPSRLTPEKINFFDHNWQELSERGLRVLAGAYKLVPKNGLVLPEMKDDLNDFIWVGIWGLADPLRLESKETLRQTEAAGIRTVIITGDNKFTAQSIAHNLGLDLSPESVVTGQELLQMDDETLAQQITNIKVYARVTPADKLRIIKAWQKRGEVVSMTGDGVNDAPALKAADVGVAVMSGSEVAKETADLVLLDNNFNTIVMSVKEGRVIFANIKKVVLYLLSGSFSEVTIILASLWAQIPLPLLTVQILWINLISDSFPALALTMEPEEQQVMNRKIDKKNFILDFRSKFIIVSISLLTGLASLWLFWYFWQSRGDLALARTVAFSSLGLVSLFYVFSIRSLEENMFKAGPFRNRYLNLAIIIGILAQLAAVYIPFFNKILHTVPLGWSEWRQILIVFFLVLGLIEIIKFIFNRTKVVVK